MKRKPLEVGQWYKTPELTVMTLETESGMVLCASSDFEDVPELDPDLDF